MKLACYKDQIYIKVEEVYEEEYLRKFDKGEVKVSEDRTRNTISLIIKQKEDKT